jgi:hypothetical protein
MGTLAEGLRDEATQLSRRVVASRVRGKTFSMKEAASICASVAIKPGEQSIIDTLPRRPEHDKASCRVYGCLMCK